MIAILGAMDGEIQEFLKALDRKSEVQWTEFTFYRGILEGREVVVAKSGVGKTLSAMVTQRILDEYSPKAILFTGLAGSISARLEIGDTLIAEDCIQHDLDATALGFKRGEVPFTSYRIIPCDKKLVQAASFCIPEQGKMVRGRVLTGDQFITRKDWESHRYLVEDLKGDAVEMEGASVGLVATVNKVPFLLIRTISDKADSNAKVDFQTFLPKASRNSLHFVRHILRRGFT
ncbi:MAG: 5'-methylthioadenosine/adenosylhomocysteine nucleosidase [Spirochaetales bacterium]